MSFNMLRKLSRLFAIKTRLEASLVTCALALGAAERGRVYLHDYPGFGGKLLLLACLSTVMLASAKIFDSIRFERSAQLIEAKNG